MSRRIRRLMVAAIFSMVLVLAALPAYAAGMADLSVKMSGNPKTIQVNKTITYALIVRNIGPSGGTSVTVSDPVPSGMRYSKAMGSRGKCGYAGGTISCVVGPLESGGNAYIAIYLIPTKTGNLVNSVSITSGEVDVQGNNNSSKVTTHVVKGPTGGSTSSPPSGGSSSSGSAGGSSGGSTGTSGGSTGNTGSGSGSTEADREKAVFNSINSQRSKQGLTKLSKSSSLTSCAKSWSRSMAQSGTLAHDPNLGNCGSWYVIGQDVGTGGANVDILAAWLDSCEHRDILMTPRFNQLGVGLAYDSSGREWWTANLSDTSGSNPEAITTIQNACMSENSFTEGKSDSVRSLGRWYTHHDSGGATTRGSENANGASDYYMNLKDPNPGVVTLTQLVKAIGKTRYTATAWTRHSSGSVQELHLDFLDGNFNRIGSKVVSTSTSSAWTEVSTGGVSSPANTAYVRVICYGSPGAGRSGAYIWDEVEVIRG